VPRAHTKRHLGKAGRRVRRGSALVTSLMLLAVISAAVAATFGMTSSERQALSDQEAQLGAYDIARSAVDRFIADPAGMLAGFNPPTWEGPDSVYFTFTNGHAWVRVQRIMPAGGGNSAMYSIRARGVRTTFQSGNTPVAECVFAQYARFQVGTMLPLAAWTSLSGLQKNGGAGTISGVDECGLASTVGGVAVPTAPGYSQSSGPSVPNGVPNILNMGTQAQANAMISVDWAGIVNEVALTPDITMPAGAWPSFVDPSYWPLIYVDQAGEFSLPGDGRGLLIVRNDMRISGTKEWDGIILVGGVLTSNGDNTVRGTVVTGLNSLLGIIVPAADVDSDTKNLRYNSCFVANAASRFGGLAPLRNTSVDNWPVY